MTTICFYILLFCALFNKHLSSVEVGIVHHLANPHVTKDIHRVNKDIEAIKSNNFTWVREGIYWEFFSNPSYLKQVRQSVKHYARENLNVLGLIAYSNPTIANGKFNFHMVSKKYSQLPLLHQDRYIAYLFAKYFEKVILVFPEIRNFEILNEMNSPKYFDGGDDPINRYLMLLEACYPIAKRYGVNMLSGGLLMEGDYLKWIDQLTRAPMNYDAFSIHPYCYPHKLSNALFTGKSFIEVIHLIRSNMMLSSNLIKDIWITEVGWQHSSDSAHHQRHEVVAKVVFQDILSDAIRVSKLAGIQKFFIYSLEDDSWDNTMNYKPFGLQLKSGVRK